MLGRSRAAPAVLAGLLVGVLAGAVAAGPADACSCLPPDLVRSYNESDTVLRVRVVRQRVRARRVLYLARVLTTYKGCLRHRRRVLLVTPRSSAACGTRLEVGRQYLVTAHRLGRLRRVLQIDSCGFNVPFETLTPEQNRFLDTRFNCCRGECRCVNSDLVQCFVDPCDVASCPEGECTPNYCGGCNAEFTDEIGQAVCQPCASSDDCGFGQHCSADGRCLSQCQSDEDCAADAWCSPAPPTPDGVERFECRPFQHEGQWCGGFTPIWAQARCAPGLFCEPSSLIISDAPGICRRSCHDSSDCRPDQYCSPSSLAPIIFDPLAPTSLDPWGVPGPIVDRPNPFQPGRLDPWTAPFEPRVCRDDGTCNAHADCNDPENRYIHPLCVGRGLCFGGHCGWVCGRTCVDLAGFDLGLCDAFLGWGVVNGSCAPISGCPASGLPLFPTREECARTCGPF